MITTNTGAIQKQKTFHSASNHNNSNQLKMKQTHRFVCMTEAVDFLTAEFNWTRQQSTHFVWDNQFTMGTDRAIWLTVPNKTL